MKAEDKINDLIFKELIRRGYTLEGNTRIWNIADSKLWYLTPKQSQAFLDLEDSEDYQKEVIQKEINLINENVDEILGKIKVKNMNMIDLGCGDGKKAVLFLDKLKGKIKVRYCPIDISGYMVEKTFERIKKMDVEEIIDFKWNISDFENIGTISALLRKGDYEKNFILLLGNTLGNFDIHELLHEIRSAMKEEDVLLIGNGLDNRNEKEILKSYSTPEVNDFLVHILLQLGLKKSDVEFGTRFINSRVELYYTLKKKKIIKFQDKEIDFNKGDQIIVAVSYKYAKEDFIGFLKMYFNDVRAFTSKDNSYALALCKK